jgi:hypothetical protein
MLSTAVPLDDLAQRITRQQAQLQRLRQEYDARQAQVTELTRRKEALQAELSQVEGQMLAIAQGKTARATPAPVRASPPKPGTLAPSKTLPGLLGEIVGQAPGPLTIKQLADEVSSRDFRTESKNLPNLVKSRVRDLLQQGRLRRASGKRGFVLPRGAKGSQAAPGKAAQTTQTSKGKKAATDSSLPGAKKRTGQPPLRDVLTSVLQKSKRPLSGGELAQLARQAGYRSRSDDFRQVVWVMLAKMEDVEHLPGQGYRLKKR